jgi:coenzyme F420-reducing hydrogenase delta subunit
MAGTNHSKPKIHIFYCSNSLDAGALDRQLSGGDADYTVIGLPCSGKADLLYLLKAFEKGADGLALITCPKSECRYLEGNLRAPKRAEETSRLLEEAGMGPERIAVLSANGGGVEEIARKLAAFREKIRGLSG